MQLIKVVTTAASHLELKNWLVAQSLSRLPQQSGSGAEDLEVLEDH